MAAASTSQYVALSRITRVYTSRHDSSKTHVNPSFLLGSGNGQGRADCVIQLCVGYYAGATGVSCAAARDSMTRNHLAQIDTRLLLLAATSRDEAMAVMEEEDLDAVAERGGVREKT